MTTAAPSKSLEELLRLLDLERIERNLFRARHPEGRMGRLYGGQIMAQALMAGIRTVDEDRPPHSLHGYFLRPGDPSVPILYQVDRIRDGHSFTTRRVVAIQHGQAIFNLQASFQRPEEGFEHQVPMPAAPDPESLPTFKERNEELLAVAPAELKRWLMRERPIDVRHANPADRLKPEPRPPRQLVWIRADGRLPDGPLLLHQCVVAYASDMTLIDTATLPHAISWWDNTYQLASLDHAMWFHRPFRADEWLLYEQESPIATGARGFTTGRLFTRDGRLVVSVAQEGLIRRRSPR